VLLWEAVEGDLGLPTDRPLSINEGMAGSPMNSMPSRSKSLALSILLLSGTFRELQATAATESASILAAS
jgi:hypothetical protein